MTPVKPSLGFKLALLLVATIVAVLFCEIAARLTFPRPPDETREPTILYQFDEELGHVLLPNQDGWIDDGLVHVNSRGFRGREIAVPKPPGLYRIVLIGDSLTLGFGVGDDQTFGRHLEERFKRRFPGRALDVVNLAVTGYNTRQEVGLLRRNVEQLEPNLVLVGFYLNDVEGAFSDGEAENGGTRIVGSDRQPGRVLHLEGSVSWWNRHLRRSRAAYVLGRTIRRIRSHGEWGSAQFAMEQNILDGVDTPEIERGWAKVEQAFETLRSLADSHYPVGIIVLPSREQVAEQSPGAKYQSRIREIAARKGFFVVDPLPVLVSRHKADDLFIPYDRNHPSALGHEVVAEVIENELVARHISADSTAPLANGPR